MAPVQLASQLQHSKLVWSWCHWWMTDNFDTSITPATNLWQLSAYHPPSDPLVPMAAAGSAWWWWLDGGAQERTPSLGFEDVRGTFFLGKARSLRQSRAQHVQRTARWPVWPEQSKIGKMGGCEAKTGHRARSWWTFRLFNIFWLLF